MGNTLLQTMKDTGSYGPWRAATRVSRLEPAHMAAAPTVSRKPARVMPEAPSPCAVPMNTSPPMAMHRPSHCQRCGVSPNKAAAMSMVMNACVCSTTEDMPAGMPSCMPVNSRPNCPTPCTKP